MTTKQNVRVALTDFDKFEKEIREQMNEAVEFSKNSPEPDASELWTDIYNV